MGLPLPTHTSPIKVLRLGGLISEVEDGVVAPVIVGDHAFKVLTLTWPSCKTDKKKREYENRLSRKYPRTKGILSLHRFLRQHLS